MNSWIVNSDAAAASRQDFCKSFSAFMKDCRSRRAYWSVAKHRPPFAQKGHKQGWHFFVGLIFIYIFVSLVVNIALVSSTTISVVPLDFRLWSCFNPLVLHQLSSVNMFVGETCQDHIAVVNAWCDQSTDCLWSAVGFNLVKVRRWK